VLQNEQTDEADRLLAAGLAGDFVAINDRLADALLLMVQNTDEKEEIRSRAAIALGPALEHADTDGFEDPDDIVISEEMFLRIQETLRRLYFEDDTPIDVRRKLLEAAVRAPEGWHRDAIRAAYSGGDEDWMLTAVFCMQYVGGFDEQILGLMESENPHIAYEAVLAAGNWELDAAWTHVSALVAARETEKFLLLAAIESVGSIRPKEAQSTLGHLLESDDEDIVETTMEVMTIAESHPETLDLHGDEEENGDNFPR